MARRLLLSILCAWGLLLMTPQASAVTFVVDNAGDGGDISAGDGTCDAGGAICTLRAAIEEANALPGTDGVDFSIDATISLGSALPTITETLNISGGTAPSASPSGGSTEGGSGSSAITVNNTIIINAPDNATDILTFTTGADFSSISNVAFSTYDHAISLTGTVTGVFIIECFFGTDGTGNPTGTQNTGILVSGTPTNTIGLMGQGNLFLNHDLAAVEVTGAADTILQYNTFGTDRSMATDVAVGDRNASEAILITGSTDTIITNNRIVRSGTNGITQVSGSGTIIQGNIIGLGLGPVSLGNIADGINLVTDAVTVNVIGADGDGTDDATEGNTISGNAGDAIEVDGATFASSIVIAGNFIGTTATSGDFANTNQGIRATGLGGLIGSNNDSTSDDLETNYIANNNSGILLDNSADGWTISNNDIGLKPDGSSPSPGNVSRGIQIGTAGPAPGAINTTITDNYIAGHDAALTEGVIFLNAGGSNTFTGNTLGANRSHVSRPNAVGLSLDAVAAAFSIGGPTAADANYFVASQGNGVEVHGTVTSGVMTFSNNTFGATSNGTLLPNATNLSLASGGITVGGAGLVNTFQSTSGGPHVAVINEAPNATEANIISQNSFLGTSSLAIDLSADGATANNALYPEAGTPNRLIDTPIITQAIVNDVTGTAEANAIIEIYTTNTGGTGLPSAGTYITTVIANGSGDFTADLTGLVSGSEFITATQTDATLDDTSEFSPAVQFPSGGRRRREPSPSNPFANLAVEMILIEAETSGQNSGGILDYLSLEAFLRLVEAALGIQQ